jgi:hypothetical protein
MKKNTTISERFLQIVDFLNVSTNDFAKKLGYSRSQAIYDVINGKSKPSFDFFEKLYNSEYSEKFNLKWLITGEGKMLNDYNSFGAVNDIQIKLSELNKKEIEFFKLQIKSLENENLLQKSAIDLYRELNDQLKIRIENLENENQDKSNSPVIMPTTTGEL